MTKLRTPDKKCKKMYFLAVESLKGHVTPCRLDLLSCSKANCHLFWPYFFNHRITILETWKKKKSVPGGDLLFGSIISGPTEDPRSIGFYCSNDPVCNPHYSFFFRFTRLVIGQWMNKYVSNMSSFALLHDISSGLRGVTEAFKWPPETSRMCELSALSSSLPPDPSVNYPNHELTGSPINPPCLGCPPRPI